MGERSETEASRLIRGTLIRVLGYGIMMALSVISTALITRDLGVNRFGEYTTAITVSTLVMTITDAGMTNVATHDYALLEGESRNQAVSILLGLRLTLTALGTVLAMALGLAAHYNTTLILGMLVATLAVFPLIFNDTLLIPLINELHLGRLSALTVGRQAVWAAGLITLSLLGAGIFPLLTTLLAANLVLVPITVRVTRSISTISLRPRFTGGRARLGATVMFSVATVVGTLYLNGTQLMTSLVAGSHQTGLYSIAFRIFIVAITIPTLVGGAAVPSLTRAGQTDPARFSYVLRRYLEMSIVAGLGLALVLCAASGFLIPLVAGPGFHAAIPVAQIQAFALIGTFVASPCSYGLLILHRYKRLLVANLAAMIVMVVGTELLASTHGAQGAAIASVCGEVVAAGLMLGTLLRSRPECRLSVAFSAKLIVAAMCTLPLAFGPWLTSLPRAVAAGTVYIIVILTTRVLPSEIFDAFPMPDWHFRS